jgi:hypothetical protein
MTVHVAGVRAILRATVVGQPVLSCAPSAGIALALATIFLLFIQVGPLASSRDRLAAEPRERIADELHADHE